MFNFLNPNPFVRNVKCGYDKTNSKLALIPFTWDNFINMDSLIDYISTVDTARYREIKLNKFDKKFIKGKDLIGLFSKFSDSVLIYGEDNFYNRISNRFSKLKTHQQKLLVRLFIFQILSLIEEKDAIDRKLFLTKAPTEQFYFMLLIEISDTFGSNKHLFFNTCVEVLKEMELLEYARILKIVKMEMKLRK